MSVQIFLSEAFVSLALFALGVAGYILSKHGKMWLLQRLNVQHGKAIDAVAAPKVALEEIPVSPSQSLIKKATTQAKNAGARRRAKRESKSKVQDELIYMCATGSQERDDGFSSIAEKSGSLEAPSAQDTSGGLSNECDVALTVSTDATTADPMEAIDAEKAECMMEMPCVVSAPEATEQQQPLSPESSSSTDLDLEEEGTEEGATTPEAYDEAEFSENLAQDADKLETDEVPRADDLCAEAEGNEDSEQCEATMASSEIDGSDDGFPDFNIPPTPPYGDDDMLMPAYTPTSAQAFTDGHQFFEPVLASDGQQLYTDGQQIFMLACVEVPPSDPSTPCAGTQSGPQAGTDPFVLLSSTYGNDVEGDLWDVCWEDFIPEAFAPPAHF